LERAKIRFNEFMDAFAGFFRVVNMAGVDDPLVRPTNDILGIVLLSSDSGFMGNLNAGVIEAGKEARGDLPADKVRFIVIGERGATKLAEAGLKFKLFPGISPETRFEQALEIRDYLVGEILEQRLGRLVVVYAKAISFTQQEIQTIKLLPCADLFQEDADSEIAARAARRGWTAPVLRVAVESSFKDMVQYLAGMWVASKLYEVFEDSKLAEFAARAMHLEESAQKLGKEHKKLKHQCFRAAHEMVDKGMRESFSSRRKKSKKVA
jgi:F0F1-type ATP synthase gamma subunit